MTRTYDGETPLNKAYFEWVAAQPQGIDERAKKWTEYLKELKKVRLYGR